MQSLSELHVLLAVLFLTVCADTVPVAFASDLP